MARLLILGATGLVGGKLLAAALAHPQVAEVVALTRRPLPPQPRLLNALTDFEPLPDDPRLWSVDAVLCALGSTRARAGSLAAQRRVDHDYPLAAARLARTAGVRCFVLNSALGAAAGSMSPYLRLKGELEQALRALDFPSLVLVRPGLLDDRERQEFRLGEALANRLLRPLTPVLPRRLRIVDPARLAAAMLDCALAEPAPAYQVLESEALCAWPVRH